jgi:hypothetical protein
MGRTPIPIYFSVILRTEDVFFIFSSLPYPFTAPAVIPLTI